MNATILGYSGGLATLTEAQDQSGLIASGSLGIAAVDYELVFIKHTGYKVKQEGATPVELGDATTHNLSVYLENPGSTFIKFCNLVPGSAIVLPLVELSSACTFAVRGNGLDHIAVEYLLVKNQLEEG